jgi:DNA (cytosine-5)-methyltransferase 1
MSIPQADVVIGGPPCQGFSLLNKDRADDPRKQMWRPYLQVVERSGASVFVIENVPQILGSAEHFQIMETASAMGFRVTWGKLCAADYGVAQVRWRAFIIGARASQMADTFPPRRTHVSPKQTGSKITESDLKPWQTVSDAIRDLPPPIGTHVRDTEPPLDLHFGRTPTPQSVARYRAISSEGMNRFDLQRIAPELTPACWIRKTKGGTDLFGRLWWDRPAFTIRTEFYKPEKGRYLHPEQHRPITHREAARFQSFPDDFVFTGSKIEIARQIGNAVPPLLAANVADCVIALLEQKPKIETNAA